MTSQLYSFVAIDFETANAQRVSACAFGYAVVRDGKIEQNHGFLMDPVGGHAPFQTRIHGITAAETSGKENFGQLYDSVSHLFEMPIVGHSMFDKQVLNALSDYFSLGVSFDYVDSVSIARARLPELKNHKLKTLVRHLDLPKFKHHDATADALACASVLLRIQWPLGAQKEDIEGQYEALVSEILSDGDVDYKEAYQLLYWLEDHAGTFPDLDRLLDLVNMALEDNNLDSAESEAIRSQMLLTSRSIRGY